MGTINILLVPVKVTNFHKILVKVEKVYPMFRFRYKGNDFIKS